MPSLEPVAIVGLGGFFPGGPDVESFWRNVSLGIDAGREVPDGRWAASPAHTCRPGEQTPDKTYSTWGCYLDDIPLSDELRSRDPVLIDGLDPVCHLALETASRAWRSAQLSGIDRQRVGVILGHIVLPTEATSAIARNVLLSQFEDQLLGGRPRGDSEKQSPPHPLPSDGGEGTELQNAAKWSPRNRQIAALPAELIAEWFELGGTTFTLDAACASSLYALKLAVDELQAGRADVMLAGGLSRPDCQYTQIGFAQLQALSKRGRCAPFSSAADGLVVGEGAAIFVLKRLSDALNAGDRIEAVIAGIGISNDRGANLLAPHSEGQLRAMQAAYDQAGWTPEDVDFMECHATGTPTGDAVELASIHQLWSDRPAHPGQCVLGAVKSNVGHLLTGAGGAGLMKVLGMLREEEYWPIANFDEPAAALHESNSPFRVVKQKERWPIPRTGRPRRAAINAFGFGGINAHVLIEEFTPAVRSADQYRPDTEIRNLPSQEVVLVGVEAHIGPWKTLAAVRERLFEHVADSAGSASFGIEHIEIPIGEFRIPPAELPDLLPQQQLMLQVTAKALDQAGVGRVLGNRAGVFIGVSLDPNTTNYHCRWMIAERAAEWATHLGLTLSRSELSQWIEELQEAFGPPLTPNRVMGNLAAITASRIAREFDVGGPSFTISANEDSGLRAMQAAVDALQRGELDLAVVGAVEFGCDLRAQLADGSSVPAHDGAIGFVLKRRADAERDGNLIITTIDLTDRTPFTFCRANDERSLLASRQLGYGLSTFGATALLSQVLMLTEGLTTENDQPQVSLQDRRDGLRSLSIPTSRGSFLRLTEAPSTSRRVTAIGLDRQLFVVTGNQHSDLLSQLDVLQQAIGKRASLRNLAREWHFTSNPETENAQAMVLMASTLDELRSAIIEATQDLQSEAREIQSDRVLYSANPLGCEGKLAFVFPGSGNAFLGMGRELLAAFPGILQRQHAENEQLRGQYRPELIWDGSSTEAIGRDHKAMIFSQVALGTAICDLLQEFGVHPDASIGYSLGESAALFGLRAWQDRDGMLERMRKSTLFGSDLVAPFDAARSAWFIPDEQPVPWVSGVINAPYEAVRDIVSRKTKAYVLIVNTPTQCVIGGDAKQIESIVRDLSASFVPLNSPSTVHCKILNEVRRDYLELHRLPTTPLDGTDVYSSATGERYGLSQDAAAGAILAQAVETVHFPQVIRNAHRDGIRLFLEIGPGNSCTRMIDEILADQPHWAGAVCPATSNPIGQFLKTVGQLVIHRVPVDLSPLFGDEPIRDDRPRVTTLVGQPHWKDLPMPWVKCDNVEDCVREKENESKREEEAAIQTVSPLTPATGERARERGNKTTHDFAGQPPHPAFGHLLPQGRGEGTLDFSPHTSAHTDNAIATLSSMLTERMEAHATFLRFSQQSQELAARLIAGELQDGDPGRQGEQEIHWNENELRSPFLPLAVSQTVPHTSSEPPRSLNYQQCLEFAIGKIGNVLGPQFAKIDQFPTRVRLPDEPLMLAHRILNIEGVPLSMTHGRVVTEHDIVPNAWYLDCQRIPTCIAVEAGQADLFLSGWLGIDLETRGLAVYRLLDAVVTFHDALPGPGKTIHYDIRINRFFQQGDTWLFRFEFDATVDGRPLLTMREGCAGFFTSEALASGKGIVHTALDKQPRPGKRPDDWSDPVPMSVESYSDTQLTALRHGDLAACFGSAFRGLPLKNPVTLPDGKMRLVDRVLSLDPTAGKYGLGMIRAEADIHPVDWFLTCHFCDDQVMPGTLMYECCLHTLRIYLLRMGWIGEAGDIVYEPIPEVRSRLKCRGQVLATTKKVWYEVTIKEIGYGKVEGRKSSVESQAGQSPFTSLNSHPSTLDQSAYCLADALMYADGKPIVEMTDMSLRLTGLTHENVERLWHADRPSKSATTIRSPRSDSSGPQPSTLNPQPLFDTDRITEFAIGKPSKAFGERYRIFDEERTIARLPGPPFQFLDRITSIKNCEAWQLAAGGVIVAEYDVPPDAWYFAANRQDTMPFAVLLETALQPCGWLAGYLGSALTSDVDLSFRNLGGKATQFQPITPQSGTLTTEVKITSVSQSAGMIIQHYSFDLRCQGEPVYQGTTYFGFFSKSALANQIGIRDAQRYEPTDSETASGESFSVPHEAPFPSDQFRMVDRVDLYLPEGGPHGLGYLRGSIDVDPEFWFFKAHFYQDPVWPGSLGLESFLQLLKVYAMRRWGSESIGESKETRGEIRYSSTLNHLHEWIYRGQVIPNDKTVTVEVEITAVDDATRTATATGFLIVDGRVIYQMKDFSITMDGGQ